jgi:hypothetical protein
MIPQLVPVLSGGYLRETQAILEAMEQAGAPAWERRSLYNSVVSALIAADVWSRLDAFYMLAAHASAAALINWKAPGAFNLTPVNSPTFTTDRGFTGDGSTSYLNTNFNPVAAAGNYAQNSNHAAVWVNQGVGDATRVVFGNLNERIIPQQATAQLNTRSAVGASDTVAITNALGNSGYSRLTGSEYGQFKNGVKLATPARASTGLESDHFGLLATISLGTPGLYSSRRIASAHFGAGLSDAQMLAAHNAINTFLTAIGGA